MSDFTYEKNNTTQSTDLALRSNIGEDGYVKNGYEY